MSMRTDNELIADIKNGQQACFGELVKRHQKFLLKSAVRLTRDKNVAEDVVQEAFLKAFRKLHLFEGRASFRSWMYQITMNTAKNKFRDRGRQTINLDKVQLAVDGEIENRVVAVDVKNLIESELERLPDRQRTAMSLRIFDDLSFQEIAEIMDCPYDTAKANYRHALLKIKARLEKNSLLKGWSQTATFTLTEIPHSMEVDG